MASTGSTRTCFTEEFAGIHMSSKRAIEVDADVDPTHCPYVEEETWPLSLLAIGVILTSAGVAVLLAAERPVYGLLPVVLGWLLVPYGVYREAEILERQGYIWSPGFRTISAASVPVLGALVGLHYLVRRHGKAQR